MVLSLQVSHFAEEVTPEPLKCLSYVMNIIFLAMLQLLQVDACVSH